MYENVCGNCVKGVELLYKIFIVFTYYFTKVGCTPNATFCCNTLQAIKLNGELHSDYNQCATLHLILWSCAPRRSNMLHLVCAGRIYYDDKLI
jgi:hypothetical protein